MGIRERMAGVPLKRQMEILQGLLETLPRPPAHVMPAFQIREMRFWIDRTRAVESSHLGGRQGKLNGPGDCMGDLSLHGENVSQIAVEGLGPEVLLGRGLNQLSRNSDSIPCPQNGSLDDGVCF